MRIIQRSRGGGKTTELLKILTEDPLSVLYVHSSPAASQIKDQIKDQNEKGEHPFIAPERVLVFGIDRLEGFDPPKHAIIDNLDLILEQMVNGRVAAVTLTI